MDNVAVKVKGIGKEYVVSHQKPTLIGNILRRRTQEKFSALKKIDLTIRKGEKVGIIGPNGAGKTTLLKIISGIAEPSTGSVITNGKVVSLMNLEAGFHPELTGEENIYINGMLIGMDKSEISKKFDRIVDFADIGNFIDAPFYTYSDGMKFRLAFSLAIVSKCDLLVLDEIFVSGDHDFQKKTFAAIREIQRKDNVTTIVTSHLAVLVWSLSNVFYRLERGVISEMSTKEMLKTVRLQDAQWRQRAHLAKALTIS